MSTEKNHTLILEYIGIDDFACPVYRDQFDTLWKDLGLGESESPSLYSVGNNNIASDPLSPIQQAYTFCPAPYRRSKNEFEYMMLGRLQSDCEYYLGYGNRNPKILCNNSVQSHIERMKELWNSFPVDEKPKWLT